MVHNILHTGILTEHMYILNTLIYNLTHIYGSLELQELQVSTTTSTTTTTNLTGNSSQVACDQETSHPCQALLSFSSVTMPPLCLQPPVVRTSAARTRSAP